jgi:hypothetical protein
LDIEQFFIHNLKNIKMIQAASAPCGKTRDGHQGKTAPVRYYIFIYNKFNIFINTIRCITHRSPSPGIARAVSISKRWLQQYVKKNEMKSEGRLFS